MQIIFDNRKKENISFEGLSSAYRKLFLGTEEGEIVLNDLLQRARICMPTSTSNSSELFYIEGMRGLFCYITSYLEERSQEDAQIKDYDPFKY